MSTAPCLNPLELRPVQETRLLLLQETGPRKIQALLASRLFGDLSPRLLGALASCSAGVSLRADETLYFEGESAPCLYLVVTGGVKLVKSGPGGREFILSLVGPGTTVAERAVFDGAGHAATAVALMPTTLLRIDGAAFRSLIRQHGELSMALIGWLADRLRTADEQMQGLALEQVEQRLARLLLDLAMEFGASTLDGGRRIGIRLTRQMLADMIGATVETTIRMMSRWTKDGLLTTARHQITLHDLQSLRRLARTPV